MAMAAIAVVAGIAWAAYEMTVADPAPVVAPVPSPKPLLPPHP